MSTIELKNKVIGKINQIDDNEILTEVYKILYNSYEDSEIYKLSDNHKVAIEIAKTQIANGEFLTNEQAKNEIDSWLKK